MMQRDKNRRSLAVAVLVITAVWLIALPRLSRWPAVRARIESHRAAGLNPTAVFYTDHPAMPEIERRMNAKVNGMNNAFWQVSSR